MGNGMHLMLDSASLVFVAVAECCRPGGLVEEQLFATACCDGTL